MRLIECDRCGERVEYRKAGSKHAGYPDGWVKSGHGFGNDLCPACAGRALEKPGVPLDLPGVVDSAQSPHQAPNSEKDMGGCCHAHVDDEDHTPIVLDSAHGDRDSG